MPSKKIPFQFLLRNLHAKMDWIVCGAWYGEGEEWMATLGTRDDEQRRSSSRGG